VYDRAVFKKTIAGNFFSVGIGRSGEENPANMGEANLSNDSI
jgi:hypothetical protein